MYDVRCFFGGEDYRLQDYRIGVRRDDGLQDLGLESMKYLKGIWQFCRYLFWPQWGRSHK